jgi:hypothetical protein
LPQVFRSRPGRRIQIQVAGQGQLPGPRW